MIRLILFAFGTILVAIETAIKYPIYKHKYKKDKTAGNYYAFAFVQRAFRIWNKCCGASALYKGLEYIPEDGDPVVYVANHRSLFDVILTFPVFKGLTGALAKIELGSMPLVGLWIKTVHGVLLDRKDHRQGIKCVLQCIENLNKGVSMLVFPEGTRSHVEGELLEFHKGTFKIPTKAKVRIVPVAISGTGDIFDDHRPFFKSHRAVIEFCPPIETKDLTAEEIGKLPETVSSIIKERITANYPEVI